MTLLPDFSLNSWVVMLLRSAFDQVMESDDPGVRASRHFPLLLSFAGDGHRQQRWPSCKPVHTDLIEHHTETCPGRVVHSWPYHFPEYTVTGTAPLCFCPFSGTTYWDVLSLSFGITSFCSDFLLHCMNDGGLQIMVAQRSRVQMAMTEAMVCLSACVHWDEGFLNKSVYIKS